MLKTATILLTGRDAGTLVVLTELPALVADRHARAALAAVGAPLDGGVVALALKHEQAILQHPELAMDLLQPFVQMQAMQSSPTAPSAPSAPLRDWRNVLALQRAALALHVSFLVGRAHLEIPTGLQAESLKAGAHDVAVNFCSPHIATVLHSGRATYRELETVLSTEDVFNLVELANVEAIRDWRAQQQTALPR